MPDLIAQDCTTLGALARHVERGSLYAVLDACDEPRIPARMRELVTIAPSRSTAAAPKPIWQPSPPTWLRWTA